MWFASLRQRVSGRAMLFWIPDGRIQSSIGLTGDASSERIRA